jgi:hypothetical protein
MSDMIEFGLDNSKIIKAAGCEAFKQSRTGEQSRITIVAFETHHNLVLKSKEKEKGSPLTDAEKAEYIAKVNAKLSEHLKKPIEQLTEADKQDVRAPKFAFAFTHYQEGIGTIRCLGKYENGVLVKPGLCCERMGDTEQTVGTVVLQYPLDSSNDNALDMDLFRMKKQTAAYIWKLGSKKCKKLLAVLNEQRNENRPTIDLRIELDGEVKYQKQNIHFVSSAAWCREDVAPDLKQWVIEQGLKNWKYVDGSLGFKMTADRLVERLGGGNTQISDEAAKPALHAGYSNLLD